jgi:hypothetical protein
METPRRSHVLQECLDSAQLFLAGNALSDAGSTSLEDVPLKNRIERRRYVILDACDRLATLHDALKAQESANDIQYQVVDPSVIRIAQELLDMIVIEGLYPSLSPNVGLLRDRMKRSHLYNHVTASLPDLDILSNVFSQLLYNIAIEEGAGLSRMIRERHAIDILAANIDLAYSPSRNISQNSPFEDKLDKLLEQYVYCNFVRTSLSENFYANSAS